MLTLRTSRGIIEWELGKLETSVKVFKYGYCANFAKVLHQHIPQSLLCVIVYGGIPQHFLCKLGSNYLDIEGVFTQHQLMSQWDYCDICDDIELVELDQNCESEYDYLAESVINEYIRLYIKI